MSGVSLGLVTPSSPCESSVSERLSSSRESSRREASLVAASVLSRLHSWVRILHECVKTTSPDS